PFLGGLASPDADKDGNSHTKLLRIQQGNAFLDNAVILQSFDAPPACILRQVNGVRDFRNRARSIALEDAENLLVYRIQGRHEKKSQNLRDLVIILGANSLPAQIESRYRFGNPAMLQRLFLEHPHSVGETYSAHRQTALRFSAALFRAAAACLVHGLIP